MKPTKQQLLQSFVLMMAVAVSTFGRVDLVQPDELTSERQAVQIDWTAAVRVASLGVIGFLDYGSAAEVVRPESPTGAEKNNELANR